jgi:hypothetical protein
VVRTQDVQIDDGAKLVLRAPVEGARQMGEGLRQRLAVLAPHLLFVDRDAHVVVAQAGDEGDVALGDERGARGPAETLRQPVAQVDAAAQLEAGRVGRENDRRALLGGGHDRGDEDGREQQGHQSHGDMVHGERPVILGPQSIGSATQHDHTPPGQIG